MQQQASNWRWFPVHLLNLLFMIGVDISGWQPISRLTFGMKLQWRPTFGMNSGLKGPKNRSYSSYAVYFGSSGNPVPPSSNGEPSLAPINWESLDEKIPESHWWLYIPRYSHDVLDWCVGLVFNPQFLNRHIFMIRWAQMPFCQPCLIAKPLVLQTLTFNWLVEKGISTMIVIPEKKQVGWQPPVMTNQQEYVCL